MLPTVLRSVFRNSNPFTYTHAHTSFLASSNSYSVPCAMALILKHLSLHDNKLIVKTKPNIFLLITYVKLVDDKIKFHFA